MQGSFRQVALRDGIAQQRVQRGPARAAHPHHERFAFRAGFAGRVVQRGQQALFHVVDARNVVQLQNPLPPLHRRQGDELFAAGPAAAVAGRRDGKTAARSLFVDVQPLRIARIGNEGRALQHAAFVDMPQRPGVEPGLQQIGERAGRVAFVTALAFHGAVQHADLKGVVPGVVARKVFGKIAAFLSARMADAVHERQHATVAQDGAAFHGLAEDGHIVGPFHGCEAGGQRVVVAVRDKDGNAEALQARAAVPQLQLRLDAALFLIIDVAGQNQEMRPFRLAQPDQPLQCGSRRILQQSRQMPFLCGFAGKPLKRRVQMQIRRMNIAHCVHCSPVSVEMTKYVRTLDFFWSIDKTPKARERKTKTGEGMKPSPESGMRFFLRQLSQPSGTSDSEGKNSSRKSMIASTMMNGRRALTSLAILMLPMPQTT